MPLPLRFQWLALPAMMLAVFPWRAELALPPEDATLVQHLLFPLVHASLLHWAVNMLSWMFLWRLVTLPRLCTAYAASVIIGYVYSVPRGFPAWIPSLCPSLPLCGFSVVVFFFLGLVYFRLPRRSRLSMLALVAVSFFVPHVAASAHLMALVLGMAYARAIVL